MSSEAGWWKLIDTLLGVEYFAYGTPDLAEQWRDEMNAETRGVDPYTLSRCSTQESRKLSQYSEQVLEQWMLPYEKDAA